MITFPRLKNYINNNIEDKKPPSSVLDKYRQAIGIEDDYRKLTEELASEKFRKLIIFVSDRPNYFFLRVSLALKEYGLSTALVTRWGVEKEQNKFFDHIFIYDKFSELDHLKHAKDCTIYVQSWVGWNFLAVYISLVTDSNIICNVNDISQLLFDQQSDLSRIGLSKEDIDIDIACERYIVDNFSLVTTPYRANAINALFENKNKANIDNIMTFPCYACSEFFDHSERNLAKPTHIFYGGMIPFDNKTDRVFGDAKMHNVITDLLKNKISVTLYNLPQIGLSNSDLDDKYKYFTSKSLLEENFVFKQGCPPWDLKNFSSNFNYGFIIYYYESDFLVSKKHYQNFLPTKLFTYIELGLPIIIIDDLVAAAELVKHNDIGIVISKEDVRNISDVLSFYESSYDQFVRNIREYRNNNCMSAMIESSGLLSELRPGE